MAALAILDLDHFRHMTGNDRDLQQEIVSLFRAQAELWRLLITPDSPVQTWEDACHTLKGAARGLGLWQLADACEDVEQLSRAGAVEGADVTRALAHVRLELVIALDALPTFEAVNDMAAR